MVLNLTQRISKWLCRMFAFSALVLSSGAAQAQHTMEIYLWSSNSRSSIDSQFRQDYTNGLDQWLADKGIQCEFKVRTESSKTYPVFRLLGGVLQGYQPQHFKAAVEQQLAKHVVVQKVDDTVRDLPRLDPLPDPISLEPVDDSLLDHAQTAVPAVAEKPPVQLADWRCPIYCPPPSRPQQIAINYDYVIQQVLQRIPRPQNGQPGPGYDDAKLHQGHLWLHVQGGGWVDLGLVVSEVNVDPIVQAVLAALPEVDPGLSEAQIIALIKQHAPSGTGGLTTAQIIALIKQHSGGLTKEETIELIQHYISLIEFPQNPIPDGAERHFVVIGDPNAAYYNSLQRDVEKTKTYFDAIYLIDPPEDRNVGTLPALVLYVNGTPAVTYRGTSDVDRMLSRIRRGEFN